MKKTLFALAALSAALFCSCNKTLTTPSPKEAPSEVSLTISADFPSTKSVNKSDDERTVNNLQVYVFNASGTRLEAYGTAQSSSLSLSVVTGEKLIAAVTNFRPTTDVTTIDALRAKVSDLDENATSSFVMFGSLNETITASTSVVVPVRSLAARVLIKKITNNMQIPQYQNVPVIVTGIFLINVGGESNIGCSLGANAIKYYNKRDNNGDVSSLLSKTLNSSLSKGASYSVESRFYCYPNPAATDNFSETWCPRFTRLVVQTSIDNQTFYYPISLKNGVAANNSYEVKELVITRLGAEIPDTDIMQGAATFTVDVLPWTDVDMDVVTI